jgi:hypothetical protein
MQYPGTPRGEALANVIYECTKIDYIVDKTILASVGNPRLRKRLILS